MRDEFHTLGGPGERVASPGRVAICGGSLQFGAVFDTAARTSTRSFFFHHLSAVAAGVMHADALTLENAAASNDFLDTRAANRAVVGAA